MNHASTIDRVDDARRRDGELAIPIRHEGRVLEDRLLAAAARALEEDLRVRVVGHDGPAAGLDLGAPRANWSVAGPKTLPTTAWKASGERSATALWRFMRLSGVQTIGEDAIVRRASMRSRALFKNTEAILTAGRVYPFLNSKD